MNYNQYWIGSIKNRRTRQGDEGQKCRTLRHIFRKGFQRNTSGATKEVKWQDKITDKKILWNAEYRKEREHEVTKRQNKGLRNRKNSRWEGGSEKTKNRIKFLEGLERENGWENSVHTVEKRQKRYGKTASCFICFFFLESTLQHFVQNERSREESLSDESLMVPSKGWENVNKNYYSGRNKQLRKLSFSVYLKITICKSC